MFYLSSHSGNAVPLSLITRLHITLGPESLMHDNKCRLIWNLLLGIIFCIFFYPRLQTKRPIGSRVKAVNSVIMATWNDNLPAVLRTHSLLHVSCFAAAAFLIQPWLFCSALIHLMGILWEGILWSRFFYFCVK